MSVVHAIAVHPPFFGDDVCKSIDNAAAGLETIDMDYPTSQTSGGDHCERV